MNEQKARDARHDRWFGADAGRALLARKPWQYIARFPYAFPGGYENIGYTREGDALCSECVRAEYPNVARDSRDKCGQWAVKHVESSTNVDSGETFCAHCGRDVSAYADG